MPVRAQPGFNLFPLLLLVTIFAVALAPILLARIQGPPSSDDAGPGSDGGSGNDPPPTPSTPPCDGLPLPDAAPARVRLRDHGRLTERLPGRPRRPAREPHRTPARVPDARRPS